MNYRFVLVDKESGTDKTHWILPPPVTVGRCPTTEIFIAEPSISRRHCQFALDSHEALVVRDLGSMNGVYLDDQRVDHAVVRPGVEVRIGTITLRIEWIDEQVSEGPASGEVWDLDATQAMKIIRQNVSSKSDGEGGDG